MDFVKIKSGLHAREVSLNAPAQVAQFVEFQQHFGFEMPFVIQSLYKEFNGFSSYDIKSKIQLWSIEMIIDNAEVVKECNFKSLFPVGDFLLNSDIISLDISKLHYPVFLFYDNIKIANSLKEFFDQIIAGAYDF